MGNVTHNLYDAYTGNLLESYRTVGTAGTKYNHTRYEYQYGQPAAVYRIASDGQETRIASNQYNAYGRLTSTTDADNLTSYFADDQNGNRTHVWHNWLDPDGVRNSVALVTVTTYDSNGPGDGRRRDSVNRHHATTCAFHPRCFHLSRAQPSQRAHETVRERRRLRCL